MLLLAWSPAPTLNRGLAATQAQAVVPRHQHVVASVNWNDLSSASSLLRSDLRNLKGSSSALQAKCLSPFRRALHSLVDGVPLRGANGRNTLFSALANPWPQGQRWTEEDDVAFEALQQKQAAAARSCCSDCVDAADDDALLDELLLTCTMLDSAPVVPDCVGDECAALTTAAYDELRERNL